MLISALIFTTILMFIAILGMVLKRNSIIHLLMAIELLLLAVNSNFIIFSYELHQVKGQLFVFFILTSIAVEAALALAILVVYYRNNNHINIAKMNQLRG